MSHNKKWIEEDSDYDSVATETQESSDEEGDYNVEELLSERVSNHNGVRYYLVNWQGYPDYRMTWEPENHVASDVLLEQWEQKKTEIDQGRAQPFDVDAWEARKDRWRAERDDRARRRKMKLKKRRMRQGLPVSTSASDEKYDGGTSPPLEPRARRGGPEDLESDEENVIMGGRSPKKRRLKAPPVKPRKGVAQKMIGARRRIITESEEDDLGDQDSDHASLFEEKSMEPDLADVHRPPAAPEGSKTSRLPITSAPKEAVTESAQQTARSAAPQTLGPGLLKKVCRPVTNSDQPTAKKSKKNVLGANAFSSKAPYRQHTIREKPKDQHGPQFKTLGQLGRMNNYGRVEPPPDINALTFVDMNKRDKTLDQTGTRPPASATTGVPKGPRESNSAYGRRTPPTEPGRTSSPPPAARPPPVDPRRKKTESCWHWMNGNCQFTEETCNFAHHSVDTAAAISQCQPQPVQMHEPAQGPTQATWLTPENTTCFYWQKDGRCVKGDLCYFAHADTGVHSHKYHSLPEQAKSDLRERMERRSLDQHPQMIANRPTCRYWQQGTCKFSDEECKYAHFDTNQQVSTATSERLAFRDGGAQPPAGPQHASGQTSTRGSASAANITMHVGSPKTLSTSGSNTATPTRSALAPGNSALSQQPSFSDTGKMTVRFQLPNQSAMDNLDATFHVSAFKHFQALFYPVDRGVCVIPDQTIIANDFRAYCANSIEQAATWPAGSIGPAASSIAVAQKVAEFCKLHVSGLLYVQDRFVVLVYPSNAEEWRYLERADAPTAPNALLRFRTFPSVDLQPGKLIQSSDTAASGDAPGPPSTAQDMQLDMDYLFEGVHENPKGQSVFIAWPSDRDSELHILQKRFSSLECKIYTSDVPGAWSYFRSKHSKASLILIHRDVPLWLVPGLNDFLQVAGGHVHFFQVQSPGAQVGMVEEAQEHDDEEQVQGYTPQRIFPDGRITYITDDVFVHHPKKALAIIQDVLKRNKGRNAKIATRPGIKDWLCKLALENTAERGRQQTPEYMYLYYAICDLCPPDDEDPDDPPNPIPSSALVSAPIDELPSFIDMVESDPAKATSFMVEWFAGWCLMNVEKFRRFVVCHEPRDGAEGDAERWRKTFQHIGVMRPEQLLEQVRKK